MVSATKKPWCDGRLIVGLNDGPGNGSETTTSPTNIYAEYHHKDHLGNVRLAFADRNDDQLIELIGNANQIEITQQFDYYPFGLQQKGVGLFHGQQEPGNRYRYNGKEFSEDIGLYEYGFRWYDPAIGKFTAVDPISDQFPQLSTYNYASNNPVTNIDLHGLQGVDPNFIFGKALNDLKGQLNTFGDEASATYSRTKAALTPSKKTARIGKSTAIIIGGIVTTVLSSGAGTGPYMAAFGATTGVFAVFAGTGKLVTDISGQEDKSDALPSSPLGATGMLIDALREDEEISAQALGEIASGFLLIGTADWNKFDALNNVDKLLTISGVVDGIIVSSDVELSEEERNQYVQQIYNLIYSNQSNDTNTDCENDCNEN